MNDINAIFFLDLRPRQPDLKRKEICMTFQELNMSCTIVVKKVFNFTLGLLYMQPGNTPLYVRNRAAHTDFGMGGNRTFLAKGGGPKVTEECGKAI